MYCQSCGAENPAEEATCFACHISLDPSTLADESTPLLHGRYRLLTQVGAGGYGAVYKVRDTQATADRPTLVAIKQTNLRGLTPQEAIEATDTFHREVALLSPLTHSNLPRIYDHFTDPEHWYLVMDFIEGETLEDYLRQGPADSTTTHRLSLDEVCRIGVQLCEVLHYLHTRQPAIIFRDLKPANIMRTPKGQLYLIDFGIARHFKPGQSRDTIPLGSPGYAAPEQYGKQQTTPQSDLYSLGALLHQLLSGEDPAENAFHFAPLRLYGDERIAELEALVTDLLEMDARKRPESATQVMEVLQRIREMGHQTRIWQAPTPQEPPRWHPTYSQQMQQQVQQQVPQAKAKTGTSRRTALRLTGALVAGVALIGGIEGLATLSRRPNLDTISYPGSTRPAPLIYPGHTNTVWSVAWSHDGTFIASADETSIQIWSAIDGARKSTMVTAARHTVAWSPASNLIAAVDALKGSGKLWGWDLTAVNNNYIFSYPIDKEGALSLAWSPDGSQIAVGSVNGVQILKVTDGKVTFKHEQQGSLVRSIAWSPDGRYLAWGSPRFNTVEIWEMPGKQQTSSISPPVEKATPVWSHDGKQSVGNAIAWSPDSQHFAFSDATDIQSWKAPLWKYAISHSTGEAPVLALAWSPAANTAYPYLACGMTKGNVYIIGDSNTSNYSGHSAAVEALAWSPDGNSIASASDDQTVQVWRPANYMQKS